MALVHVGPLHGVAHRKIARVGFFAARDEFEERRFSGPVRPDDAHDARRGQGEAEVLEQQFVAVGFGHVVGFDDLVAQARPGGDEDFEAFFLRPRFLVEQFFVGSQPGFRLGLPGFGGHAHPFEFALKGFLALRFGFFFLRQPLLLLIEPRRIVALPGNAFAPIEFQNPARHVVEEIPVVGYGDDRALVLPEVFFEPEHALGVEVVGRFVEQQHVGFLQEQAAQGHAAFFPARKIRRQRVRRWAAQGIHRFFELGVEFPGVELVEAFLHFALPGEEFIEVGVGVGEGFVDLLELVEQGHGFGGPFLHHFAHGFGGVQLGFLFEHPDRVPRREHHLTRVTFVAASDDLQ